MQILTGTRKESTIFLWREQIEKHINRANDSMECFRRFSDTDSLEHLIEDCKRIIENAEHAITAIETMEKMGIE